MSIAYEWCAEEHDEHGDVIELHFTKTRAEAEAHRAVSKNCTAVRVCLIRNRFRLNDLADRQWAYVENGKLPPLFSGGAAVPARYRT